MSAFMESIGGKRTIYRRLLLRPAHSRKRSFDCNRSLSLHLRVWTSRATINRTPDIDLLNLANTLEPTRGSRMFERLPVVFRSAMYSLRGGFLIRPLAIAVVFGAVGAVLSSLEESTPEISAWIPHTLFPSHEDPGVAQMILSSVATSIMTVVSIVFAILLMTLTLASTQFSPRILISFVRDRTTQWTLGVFL